MRNLLKRLTRVSILFSEALQPPKPLQPVREMGCRAWKKNSRRMSESHIPPPPWERDREDEDEDEDEILGHSRVSNISSARWFVIFIDDCIRHLGVPFETQLPKRICISNVSQNG